MKEKRQNKCVIFNVSFYKTIDVTRTILTPTNININSTLSFKKQMLSIFPFQSKSMNQKTIKMYESTFVAFILCVKRKISFLLLYKIG